MNLQEILNYHNECIICQTPMILTNFINNKRFTCTLDDIGIKTYFDNKLQSYINLDGELQLKKNNPLLLIKKCPHCFDAKTVSHNFVSISNIIVKNPIHYYSFEIQKNKMLPLRECLKFIYNDYSYQIYNNIEENKSSIHKYSMSQDISSYNHLRIQSKLNLSNIKNLDQLLGKIQLYYTFS